MTCIDKLNNIISQALDKRFDKNNEITAVLMDSNSIWIFEERPDGCVTVLEQNIMSTQDIKDNKTDVLKLLEDGNVNMDTKLFDYLTHNPMVTKGE